MAKGSFFAYREISTIFTGQNYTFFTTHSLRTGVVCIDSWRHACLQQYKLVLLLCYTNMTQAVELNVAMVL